MSDARQWNIPERRAGRDQIDHGRDAERPANLPRRRLKDVAIRVKEEIRDDDVGMMAAGMAFYAMLAIFPALIALVALYGLVASPADVEAQLSAVAGQLPEGARSLLRDQLQGIVAGSSGALGLGLVVSVVAALWTASSGAVGMIKAVNRAYDQEETRGFLQLRLLGIAFTLGAIAVAAVAIFALGVLPSLFEVIGLGAAAQTAVSMLRWVGLALLVVLGLGAVYRHAPDRDRTRERWVSWGAVLATLLWIGITALFGLYVSQIGSYQSTYGALGGVIVLLMWLFLSSFAVLLGAEVNSELEAQSGRDTTVRAPAPRRERGARKAAIGELQTQR